MYYNALPMYVRLHIEKSTDAEYIGTYRTCIMYARTAPTDVLLHELNVDARTYIEEKKIPAAVSTYLPLHVRTYCTYLVLGYLLMYVRTYCAYCCSCCCTYVPTVRTALSNAINAHLLHKTVVPTVRTYCCTYSWWCMLLSTAVRTSCTYCKYLQMTYVRKERKAETYQKKTGRGRPFWMMEDMANICVDSWRS